MLFSKRVRYGFLLLAAMCATVQPLHSAFPGRNGRIIFLQGPNGNFPNVFSMNPDGSGERQITHFNGVGLCCEAVSPDGRRIVFTEFPTDAPAQVWMVNADGSDLHKVLSEPDAGSQNASFSPDGRWLFYTRCIDTGCAIYRAQSDGGGVKEITRYQKDVFDFTPVVSPDGRTIAFNSFNRGGILGAIYLMNADGSDLHRLTPPALGGFDVDWSPDGSKLVFATHCCNPQNPEIWMIGVDGSDLRRLTHNDTNLDFTPAWAPEGNAITFYRYFPSIDKSAIYVLELGGNRETMVRQMAAPHGMREAVRRPLQAGPLRHHPKQIEFDAFRPKWAVAH